MKKQRCLLLFFFLSFLTNCKKADTNPYVGTYTCDARLFCSLVGIIYENATIVISENSNGLFIKSVSDASDYNNLPFTLSGKTVIIPPFNNGNKTTTVEGSIDNGTLKLIFTESNGCWQRYDGTK